MALESISQVVIGILFFCGLAFRERIVSRLASVDDPDPSVDPEPFDR